MTGYLPLPDFRYTVRNRATAFRFPASSRSLKKVLILRFSRCILPGYSSCFLSLSHHHPRGRRHLPPHCRELVFCRIHARRLSSTGYALSSCSSPACPLAAGVRMRCPGCPLFRSALCSTRKSRSQSRISLQRQLMLSFLLSESSSRVLGQSPLPCG